MLCKQCNAEKQSRYCNKCQCETPTLHTKELLDHVTLEDTLKNVRKSASKVRGKPKNELIQYVGNRDKYVVSEIEKFRETDRATRVIHRLWRRFGNVFKNIHDHDKKDGC